MYTMMEEHVIHTMSTFHFCSGRKASNISIKTVQARYDNFLALTNI